MYTRLPFQDYFTICSNNICEIVTDLKMPIYKEIAYKENSKKKNRLLQYCVRYDKERKAIEVLFQQTASLSDWKVNFNFPAKAYDAFTWNNQTIQLKIHRGWLTMWMAGRDRIRKEIQFLLNLFPDSDIVIYGYSLGSALAQIASEDCWFYFKKKPYLYTFGSVKPFYGEENKEFLRQCCAECYNFQDNNDLVTKMPPFKHWFAINPVRVSTKKTCLFRLLNPFKYHLVYGNSDLYKNIK